MDLDSTAVGPAASFRKTALHPQKVENNDPAGTTKEMDLSAISSEVEQAVDEVEKEPQRVENMSLEVEVQSPFTAEDGSKVENCSTSELCESSEVE